MCRLFVNLNWNCSFRTPKRGAPLSILSIHVTTCDYTMWLGRKRTRISVDQIWWRGGARESRQWIFNLRRIPSKQDFVYRSRDAATACYTKALKYLRKGGLLTHIFGQSFCIFVKENVSFKKMSVNQPLKCLIFREKKLSNFEFKLVYSVYFTNERQLYLIYSILDKVVLTTFKKFYLLNTKWSWMWTRSWTGSMTFIWYITN